MTLRNWLGVAIVGSPCCVVFVALSLKLGPLWPLAIFVGALALSALMLRGMDLMMEEENGRNDGN